MTTSRNQTGYYIKEGITSIFAHSLMSFVTVCIIVSFLIIMGSFVLIAVNINAIIGELESENIILVYVDENLSDTEARALGPVIRSTPNVTEVKFTSREEALQSFIGKYGNKGRYTDVDSSWLRHRYYVYVREVALIGETQQALRDIYGVATVNANLKIAQGLVTLRNIISGASIVIVSVLLVISLFIMSNTIKLATFERREEIAIMKIVGATNSFIRWPFVFEGFILGVIGALAAFAALWGLYGLVTRGGLSLEVGFVSLLPFSSVSTPMCAIFTAIGFGVGVGGSSIALNKYLKV